jgi:hypothetical protein
MQSFVKVATAVSLLSLGFTLNLTTFFQGSQDEYLTRNPECQKSLIFSSGFLMNIPAIL